MCLSGQKQMTSVGLQMLELWHRTDNPLLSTISLHPNDRVLPPTNAMLLLKTAMVKHFVGFAIKNTPVTDVVISQTTQDLSHPPQSESVTNISSQSVLNGISSRAIAEFIKHIGFDNAVQLKSLLSIVRHLGCVF